jgi:hypothetical protein
MRLPFVIALAAASVFAVPTVSTADTVRKVAVRFPAGASGVTLAGRIAGRDSIVYMLSARAGQVLRVTLETRSTSLHFNVYVPGKGPGDEALYISDQGGNSYSGPLPADGSYSVSVFLNRAAARRGEAADFQMRFDIDGAAPRAGGAAPGRTDVAMRAGRGEYDATGKIPCAQASGQPMGQCDFGVARAGGGTAAVVVTLADGAKRIIFFEGGKAVGSDASEASGGAFRAARESDLNRISIGNERYEIPDAAIFGG